MLPLHPGDIPHTPTCYCLPCRTRRDRPEFPYGTVYRTKTLRIHVVAVEKSADNGRWMVHYMAGETGSILVMDLEGWNKYAKKWNKPELA